MTTSTMLPVRIALALTTLAAGCARAQESQGQDSRARFRDTGLMLESSEPAKIAWGAWNAREDLERKAPPHLATALAQSVKIENVLLETLTAKLGTERATRKGLRWRSARAFEQDLGALQQGVLDQHAALVRRLVTAKLMTPDEAKALACKVEVKVRDDRGDKREPLPQLGFTLLER